jgi:hypothetical protein
VLFVVILILARRHRTVDPYTNAATLTFMAIIAIIDLAITGLLIAQAVLYSWYDTDALTSYRAFSIFGPLAITPVHMSLLWAFFPRGVIARKTMTPYATSETNIIKGSPAYEHHYCLFFRLSIALSTISAVVFALSMLDCGWDLFHSFNVFFLAYFPPQIFYTMDVSSHIGTVRYLLSKLSRAELPSQKVTSPLHISRKHRLLVYDGFSGVSRCTPLLGHLLLLGS